MNECENSIIACLCFDESHNSKSLDVLEGKHFLDGINKTIFQACLDLRKRDLQLSYPIILEEIKSKLTQEELEKTADMLVFYSNKYMSSHWKSYCRKILEEYTKREVSKMASELSVSLDTTKNLTDILQDTKDRLDGLSREIIVEEKKDAYSILSKMYDEFDEIDRSKISTGYDVFDKYMGGGMHKTELIVIAARPGMGKSALAVNMCAKIAKEGYKTAFISLEMSAQDVAKRLMVSEARVKYEDMGTSDIGVWLDTIKDLKISINDKTISSLSGVRSYIMDLKESDGLDVIFVDYLQLLSANKKHNRYEQVSEISRALKIMCLEYNITIIALSQLSRSIESRPDKVPQLSDLRESGSIEQDADRVIGMMRPSYYWPDETDKRKTNIYVLKNRHGCIGQFTLNFDGEYMRFYEYTI